ncbi:MAG: glutamine--fructose-6-phosphate transaminase (isomerizing) [Sphingobacteriia bacterium]|nr:glutamine--fructose-6-phosphate transaminase (isomerizing) [Sphingobacteriia bacterium]
MCGIFAVVSKNNVVDLLVSGLKALEYRGYDSSGLAVLSDKEIITVRATGKVINLEEKLKSNLIESRIGIAHTRWATHGKINELNAHPHVTKDIAIVLNGIIENFLQIKEMLISKGYSFFSETDAEVAAVLIQYYIDLNHSHLEAIKEAVNILLGSYSIIILHKEHEQKLFAVKKGAPVVIGINSEYGIVSSDIYSLANLVENVYFLEDKEIAEVSINNFQIYNLNLDFVPRETLKHNINIDEVSKGEFETFMQKEIYEQPAALKRCREQYIDITSEKIIYNNTEKLKEKIKDNITIVACGSSYYAALLAKHWFEEIANIKVDVEIASEFISKNYIFRSRATLLISQSGETKDTISALEAAKSKGQYIISLVNVVESTIARLSDIVLPIYAGQEIGVASTKAFLNQLLLLYLIVLITKDVEGKKIKNDILEIESVISESLKIDIPINIIELIKNSKTKIFTSREILLPIAYEACLKLKELSYLQAETIPAGEMKHGPIALIDESSIVIGIANSACSFYEKIISNFYEINSRGGKILAIIDKNSLHDFEITPYKITVPNINNKQLAPFATIIVFQKIAYEVAKSLGNDVDKPRNLAKSVTVE